MYTLLIVDDEPRIRRGLEKQIPWESMNFTTIHSAENGKQALESVMANRPHLIITDIRMPDMDGLEFIQEIRDRGIHSQIIIISGYNDFTYAQTAIRFGVSDYLLKPINENTLYNSIINCTKKLELATAMEPILKKWMPDSETETNNLIVQQAKKYIREHYHETFTLKTVADELAIHPNYLCNLFSKFTGESIFNYATGIRIAKSKELLQNPQLKIYEIAEMVGYHDYRWFSKLFKQYESVSPQQYRSNISLHTQPQTKE